MRIVVTIVGKDRVGIIARVSNVLAEHNINILNINQNIMDGFFNMVLIANMENADLQLDKLKDVFTALGEEIGVEARVQSEEILPPCTAFRRARQCLKLRTFWKPRA